MQMDSKADIKTSLLPHVLFEDNDWILTKLNESIFMHYQGESINLKNWFHYLLWKNGCKTERNSWKLLTRKKFWSYYHPKIQIVIV